jgi:hypothetical protein
VPQSRESRKSSELELLRALIDGFDGSSPSQVEVEKGLESGLARLMLLEGRLREQASVHSMTPPGRQTPRGEDPEKETGALGEEIRALREAIAELRARAQPGPAALAHGFVIRRKR